MPEWGAQLWKLKACAVNRKVATAQKDTPGPQYYRTGVRIRVLQCRTHSGL